MDGKIFNSIGVQVGVVTGGAIYGLKGHKLYELKGANIFKLSGELMGHLNASHGSQMRLDAMFHKLDEPLLAHCDGAFDDIFELQDQVTMSVVGAIAPKLEQAEIERSKRKPTENLDAYDYYLRGVASAIPQTREGDNEALRLFYRAIELDPDFAVAYGWAAWMFVNRKSNGWMTNRALEIAEATRLGRRAAELGDDDAAALCGAATLLPMSLTNSMTGSPILIGRSFSIQTSQLRGIWAAG